MTTLKQLSCLSLPQVGKLVDGGFVAVFVVVVFLFCIIFVLLICLHRPNMKYIDEKCCKPFQSWDASMCVYMASIPNELMWNRTNSKWSGQNNSYFSGYSGSLLFLVSKTFPGRRCHRNITLKRKDFFLVETTHSLTHLVFQLPLVSSTVVGANNLLYTQALYHDTVIQGNTPNMYI